ncbi:MAG: MBL fold metallo-hydrolase [Propionibacteriaceae bacterium]|jgi:glyoxylase-like metal-dependent hydrolase (beta-lactamase superfamily II)|nr:MBL fold metallo-hydrolase [Propionibacteriaceae bacterium]
MTGFSIGEWTQIAPAAYRAVAEPETVNIGLVLGSKHVLLVDTGSCPAQGAAIAESVWHRFERKIDRVVVTHAHYDHWFGLCAFTDVKTYGQAGLLDELSSGDSAPLASQLGFSPEFITAPQNLILEWGSFNLGGEQVQLRHFGPAHSNSDLVVYLPQQRLAFVGDLLEESGAPHFGPDSTVSTWPGVIDQIIALVDPDTTLVPGHGKPVDVAFAAKQRDDLCEFHDRVRERHTQGYGLQQALRQTELDGKKRWPFDITTAREATICIYAELGQLSQPTDAL